MRELKKQHMSDQLGKPVSEVKGDGGDIETTSEMSIVTNDPTLMYDEDLGKVAKRLAREMDKHVENADNEAKEYNRKLAKNWPIFLEIRNRFDNQGYRTDLIKEGSDTDKKRKRTKDDLMRTFGAKSHKEWVQKNFPWSVQYHNRKLRAFREVAECTQKLLTEGSETGGSDSVATKTSHGSAAATRRPNGPRDVGRSDFNRYKHVALLAYQEAQKFRGHPLAETIKAALLQHKLEPISGTWLQPIKAIDSDIAKLAIEMSEIVNGQFGDKLMASKAGKKLLRIAKRVLTIKGRPKVRLAKELQPKDQTSGETLPVIADGGHQQAVNSDQERKRQIAA